MIPKLFRTRFFLLGMLLLPVVPACVGAAGAPGSGRLDITVETGRHRHGVGDTVVLAVRCEIPQGFHLYGNPLGPGIGKPLRIRAQDCRGITWLCARKSAARKYQPDAGPWVWAYEKNATFFLIGILASDSERRPGGVIVLEGLLCSSSCIPIKQEVPFEVLTGYSRDAYPFANDIEMRAMYVAAEPVVFARAEKGRRVKTALPATVNDGGEEELEKQPQWEYAPVEAGGAATTARRQSFAARVVSAILLAFLAGIILNAMPCVLPVLGVKILSFSEGVRESRRVALGRSLAFAAGMMVVFLALATLAAFAGYSWGQHFQNPLVLSGIVVFIVVFALGMFDLYTIMVPVSVGALERHAPHTLAGEFIRGLFATLLATPCSGPFLGATLAWTLTQPPRIIYAVFISIGLGMASPYVVLSASRRIAKLVPKPGRWMVDFRNALGFVLLAFAVYLMRGLTRELAVATAGMCVSLALGIGIFRRFAPRGSGGARRAAVALIALAVCAAGGRVSFDPVIRDDCGPAWRAFSARALNDSHATGRHVLVNFTANWCVNCQYNKLYVLRSRKVRELCENKDVLLLEVDLTNRNADGESLLHHLGSKSVPFLALFRGDDPYCPVVMRDILNPKALAGELEKLPEKEE